MNKVQGTTSGEVAPETGATPASEVAEGTITTPVTPTKTQPTDANNVDAVRQKLEADINKMKSVFQKQLSDREKEWKKTEARLRQEAEEARISSMDEDQRKQYEAGATSRRMAEMEQQLAELSQAKQNTEAMFNAYNYFIAQGVPADQMVVDAGYEELWNSGMGYMTDELKRLKAQGGKPVPVPEVKAPEVVTSTSTPAYTGTTWPELIKRFGSEEEVYSQIESGRLSPDILPHG